MYTCFLMLHIFTHSDDNPDLDNTADLENKWYS